MRLIILGAGQYGLVAKEIVEAMNAFDNIEFLDDNSDLAIGKIADLEHIEYDAAFVVIGNPDVREKLISEVGDNTITLIHPCVTVMSSAQIGVGCIVEAGAVISSNTEIGTATIVMGNAVVGHDAKVGRYCQLKYNCSIYEKSSVPNKTKIDCNVV